MTAITLIDKHTAEKTAATTSHLTISVPTVVEVEVRRADVLAIERSGNSLVLRLHNGEVLTFDNFYVPTGDPVNDLVLIEDRGALWWFHSGADLGEAEFTALDSINPLLLQDQGSAAWLLLPLVVGAVLASDGDSTPSGPKVSGQVNDAGTDISGKTTPGADVVVRDALGNPLGTTKADANGNFDVTLTRPLEHKEEVSVAVTDDAGHTGSETVTYIDHLAPAVLAVPTVTDDIQGIVGPLKSGDLSNDNHPTFSGHGATPGDVIHIYDDGVLIGSATVDGAGNWSITPPIALDDGAHSFVATEVDPAGNESTPSAPFILIIDTAPPWGPDY